jgi:hypothetical protein
VSRNSRNGCSNIVKTFRLDKAVSGLGFADKGSTELVQKLRLFGIAKEARCGVCVSEK